MAHVLKGDASRLRAALLTALGDFRQVADIFAQNESSDLDLKSFYYKLWIRCLNLQQILAENTDPNSTRGLVRGVLRELESFIIIPPSSCEGHDDYRHTFPGLRMLNQTLATLVDPRSKLETLQKCVAFENTEKRSTLLALLFMPGIATQPETHIELCESGLAPLRKIRQKPPDDVRPTADSLFTVLKTKGECDCVPIHNYVVQLSLETHRTQMCSCDFNLFFGLEKFWQEARVISAPVRIGIPSLLIQHDNGNASRGSIIQKGQQRAVSKLCKDITTRLPNYRLKFRVEGHRLWKLKSEESDFAIDKSEAPVSLTQLLDEGSTLFNDRIKRILSVSLGYGVLHLHETSWLSPTWGSCNVMFFRSSTGLPMRPYLTAQLADDSATHQVDSCSDDEFDPDDLLLPPYPCLIGLATVLMELHKAASLESLLEFYDIESTDGTDLASRFIIIRELFRCCSYEFTDQTRMAISACLDPKTGLDSAGEKLGDTALQSVIYERIVRLLEDELESGFSDVTVDQLDDLIQKLDLAHGGQPSRETKTQWPRPTSILARSFQKLGIGRRIRALSSSMSTTPNSVGHVRLPPHMILTTSAGTSPIEQMESTSNSVASKSASVETHRNFVPPPLPAKTTGSRPDTLRVMNIPDNMSSSDLSKKLERYFASNCRIHSLARASRDARWKKHATVTFPELSNSTLAEIVFKLQHRNIDDHFEFDQRFLGLTPLYDEGHSAIVDIIAIEGLGTNPFGTFRAPQGDSMWLRDFLPDSFPSCRILLYGYDSKVPGSMSNQSVPEIASTCKNFVTNFRRMTKSDERPIIWLGQSMGGLIVQEVLVQAHQYRSQRSPGNLSDQSIGFLGYGVPMNGLRNESLLNAVKKQPNFEMIRSICLEGGRPSRYLQDLANRFALCNERISIHHFYETNPSPDIWDPDAVPQRRVDDQGVLGREDRYWVPRNHSELVKVPNRTDIVYTTTVQIISLILERQLPETD